jgi:hypothetical protein
MREMEHPPGIILNPDKPARKKVKKAKQKKFKRGDVVKLIGLTAVKYNGLIGEVFSFGWLFIDSLVDSAESGRRTSALGGGSTTGHEEASHQGEA